VQLKNGGVGWGEAVSTLWWPPSDVMDVTDGMDVVDVYMYIYIYIYKYTYVHIF
jgi:hypothetical protein